MNGRTSSLVAPVVVVALVSGMLGFFVQRQLAPPRIDDSVRVSVIALPATPEPSPTPSPTPEVSVRINGRSSRIGSSGTDGGVPNCPAGCRCESRPPAGVVIICR